MASLYRLNPKKSLTEMFQKKAPNSQLLSGAKFAILLST
jgi:hypothetical protein